MIKFILPVLLTFLAGSPLRAATAKEKQSDSQSLNIELRDFAKKKMLSNNDQKALIANLKKILILEPLDPSRNGAGELTDLYLKHKNIFKHAFKEFKPEEQKTLKEIFEDLERERTQGNG